MSFVLGHRRTDRPLWRRMPRILRFIGRLIVDQEGLLFQPGVRRRHPSDALDLGAVDIELPGAVSARYLPPANSDPSDSPAILYLPGAIGDLDRDLASLRFLHRLGAAVLAIDYPGYGRSPGRPSLAGCRRAAGDAWSWLTRRHPGAPAIVFGRSFGGVLAAELAAERGGGAPTGLVMLNAFTSVADMAATVFPRWLVRLGCRVRLDAAAAAARCPVPALVLHARDDEVVRLRFGRALFAAAAPPKRFVTLAGGHFDDRWHHDPAVRRALEALLSGAARAWGEEAGGEDGGSAR